MAITRTNGVFTGTIVLPGTATPLPFRGAILQSRTHGYGFFRSAGQSGWVIFGPAE